MKHCILGSGLIGSYLNASIRLNTNDVSVVARGDWKQRLQQPLLITDYQGGSVTVPPAHIVSEARPEQPFDIVWLTVKCTALDSIHSVLSELIGPDSVIICCQNGIGSHAIIENAFPKHRVYRAMIPFNVVLAGEQHLHKGSEGTLVIQKTDDHALNETLKRSVQSALVNVTFSDNIEAVQWAKLQLNLGNGVNALSGLPVKAMLENRGYRQVIAGLMDELLLVTRCAHISLPKVANVHGKWMPHILRLPNWLFSRVAQQMLAIDPEVKTSMWWDLHMGKQTEKDFLYGAVIAKGEALGLATPNNQAILRLLRQAENEVRQKGSYTKLSAHDLLSN